MVGAQQTAVDRENEVHRIGSHSVLALIFLKRRNSKALQFNFVQPLIIQIFFSRLSPAPLNFLR